MRFTLEFASESHEELGLVWLKASFSSVQAKDVVLVMVFLVLDVVLLFVLVHTFFSYAPANPVLISNGRGWLLHKKSSISLARHEGVEMHRSASLLALKGYEVLFKYDVEHEHALRLSA